MELLAWSGRWSLILDADLVGLPEASSLPCLLLLALSLKLASVSRCFLDADVLLCMLEEFDVGLRKCLIQKVGELRVLKSPLHHRDGCCLIEVLDLQGGGVETHHKLSQRFSILLVNREKAVNSSGHSSICTKVFHEQLLELFERIDASRL